MIKTPPKLDIFDIEWNLYGALYVSKGHHDKTAFIKALETQVDCHGFTEDDVVCGHMRCWPDKSGNYSMFYAKCEPGRGAFAATWVESKSVEW
jgi:hypothetical protein